MCVWLSLSLFSFSIVDHFFCSKFLMSFFSLCLCVDVRRIALLSWKTLEAYKKQKMMCQRKKNKETTNKKKEISGDPANDWSVVLNYINSTCVFSSNWRTIEKIRLRLKIICECGLCGFRLSISLNECYSHPIRIMSPLKNVWPNLPQMDMFYSCYVDTLDW